MNRHTLRHLVLAAALAGLPTLALACSEGMFNTGKGLAYQAYLAPRPATVLIYSTAPGDESKALHSGLQKAGHRVTVVQDDDALAAALAGQRFDVVITGLESAEQVAATPAGDGAAPKLLPVVARSERNSPLVRGRFDVFVVDGSSLGQYLRGINRILADRAR